MQNFGQSNSYQQMGYRLITFRMIPIANESDMAGVTVDYSGNPTYFHNQSTNEIYIKYFDIKTGLTPIIKYVREDSIKPVEKPAEVVPNYTEQLDKLNEKFDKITKMLEQRPKVEVLDA